MPSSRFTKSSCLWIDAAGVGVCVALSLVTYFAGIEPILGRHEACKAKRTELASRRDELGRLSASLQELQDRRARVSADLAQCPLRLQAASRTNRRLAEIAELATTCGLKVDAIQPGHATAGALYDIVPIRLTGTGKYPTCVQFLHKLQKVFPDTGVISLDLAGGDPPGRPAAGSFHCQLKWHTAPQPRGVKKVRADLPRDGRYRLVHRTAE